MNYRNRRSRSPVNRYGNNKFQKRQFDCEITKIDWPTIRLMPFKKNFYVEHPIVTSRSSYEIERFRSEKEMTVVGKNVPRPIFNFNEMNFTNFIMSTIVKNKWVKPTPIQCQGWPMAMSGRNVVGIAQTGSGKTAAFLLPALIHIRAQPPLVAGDGPICLVLVPTRELAQQVESVVEEFGISGGFNMVCVYGGSDRLNQIKSLQSKRPEILVATPGRLLDLLKQNETNLRRTTYLVLDEADRMLDMGFEPQIRAVLNQVRPDRQMLLWSATWPIEVRRLAEDFLNEYIQVNIGAMSLHANHNICQYVEVIDELSKERRLIDLLTQFRGLKTLVFVALKKRCDRMSDMLNCKSFKAIAMHGDKPQRERERALENFRNGRSNIMVATDVASRGLDIDDIMLVINYDFPTQIEDYVHRIGRTARQEKKGTSYTFFTNNEKKHAQKLVAILEEANQNISDKLYDLAEVPFSSRKKSTSNVPKGLVSNPVSNNWVENNKRVPSKYNGTVSNRDSYYHPVENDYRKSDYYNGRQNEADPFPQNSNSYRESGNWRNTGSYNNYNQPQPAFNNNNNTNANTNNFNSNKALNYNEDFNSMGIIANRW